MSRRLALAACLCLAPAAAWSWSGTPLWVEGAWLHDDNLNRAPDSAPQLSDHLFSISAGKGFARALTEKSRLSLSGFVTGEKAQDQDGLDRFTLGARAELQYRTSGAFTAPTYALYAGVSVDDYKSELRSGNRVSLGASVQLALTDRIEAHAALARESRSADHPVFDGGSTSLRGQLDYALGRGTLYAAGELRRGDAVSSTPYGLQYALYTKAWAPDDAYERPLNAYRYDARTTVWTLGYNWPLGSTQSLDFSVLRAEAKPTELRPYSYYGDTRYTATQLSAAYLARF